MAPAERKPRGLNFNDKHLEEFGLKKINVSPVTVRCNFCVHFGREERAGAKRKSTTNWTSFETGSFQTQNYRQHLLGAHPKRWAMYQELGVDPVARMEFWDQDPDESTPFTQARLEARTVAATQARLEARASASTGQDKKRSPHKARGGLGKVTGNIDNLTEIYIAELKKLKELASMSDDPEVYGEGKKILSFIKHVEEGRAKHGI
jgi:hypothetical protein